MMFYMWQSHWSPLYKTICLNPSYLCLPFYPQYSGHFSKCQSSSLLTMNMQQSVWSQRLFKLFLDFGNFHDIEPLVRTIQVSIKFAFNFQIKYDMYQWLLFHKNISFIPLSSCWQSVAMEAANLSKIPENKHLYSLKTWDIHVHVNLS